MRLQSTIHNANYYETTTLSRLFHIQTLFPNSPPLQCYLSPLTCESAKRTRLVRKHVFKENWHSKDESYLRCGCEWQDSSLNVSAEQTGGASLWASIWTEQIPFFYWCRSSATLPTRPLHVTSLKHWSYLLTSRYSVLHLTLTVKLSTAQEWDKGAFIDTARLLLEVPEHSRGIWDLCVCTK